MSVWNNKAVVAGCCYAEVVISEMSWTDLRNLADANPNNTFIEVGTVSSVENGTMILTRGFVIFDTSNLPENFVVDSASLFVYVQGSIADTDEGESLMIGHYEPNDFSEVTQYDYSSIAHDDLGHLELTSVVSDAYNEIPLNASGIAEIGLAADNFEYKTAFSLQMLLTDAGGTEPTDNMFGNYTGIVGGADTNRPYLVINYHTVGGAVYSKNFEDFVTASDQIYKTKGITVSDSITASDQIRKQVSKSLVDTVTASDQIITDHQEVRTITLNLSDSVSANDQSNPVREMAPMDFTDSVTVSDLATKVVHKYLSDEVTASDVFRVLFNPFLNIYAYQTLLMMMYAGAISNYPELHEPHIVDQKMEISVGENPMDIQELSPDQKPLGDLSDDDLVVY